MDEDMDNLDDYGDDDDIDVNDEEFQRLYQLQISGGAINTSTKITIPLFGGAFNSTQQEQIQPKQTQPNFTESFQPFDRGEIDQQMQDEQIPYSTQQDIVESQNILQDDFYQPFIEEQQIDLQQEDHHQQKTDQPMETQIQQTQQVVEQQTSSKIKLNLGAITPPPSLIQIPLQISQPIQINIQQQAQPAQIQQSDTHISLHLNPQKQTNIQIPFMPPIESKPVIQTQAHPQSSFKIVIGSPQPLQNHPQVPPQIQAPPSQAIQIAAPTTISFPIQIPAQPTQLESQPQLIPPLYDSQVNQTTMPLQPVIQAFPSFDQTIDISQDQQISGKQGKQSKKQKLKKQKKVKGRGDLMHFYDISKVKVTMEFDPQEKRARGQVVFKFAIKAQEEIETIIQSLKSQDMFKKYQLDLHIQAKAMDINTISIINNKNEGAEIEHTQVAFEYPPINEQEEMQKSIYEKVSRDINSLESTQKRCYEDQEKKAMILAKKIVSISFKKEDLIEQLPRKMNILVRYYLGNITNFGINAVKYKIRDQISGINSDQHSTFFHTTDSYDSKALWMPVILGHSFIPLEYTIKYIVPSDYTVISSGNLYFKQIEEGPNSRALFHYKLKHNEMAPAIKIGFIFGKFPVVYKMQQSSYVENAYAFFESQEKHQIFIQNNRFFEQNISNILQYLQQKLIKAQYPFKQLKLVFVPNLFLRASRKQSFDFIGGLHLVDEELLFARNQWEGRHHTYKYLASCLAFDYFGGRVYEESSSDLWLLIGIRESIGNHYKIKKCGILLYRYHIMKTIESVYKKAKHGFERYPLRSTDVPDPNDLMLNELMYEKSELIMHMIESMIDKSCFESIIQELYHQSTPMISTRTFLKIFKQVCGFKLKSFADNWIDSTSCPKLTVSYNYNKKNNSLDLTLTQESAMKDYFSFRKYISDKLSLGDLLIKPFLRKDPFYQSGDSIQLKQDLAQIESMNKFLVCVKSYALKWFEGEVNVMLYITDGADISTQQQKMSLKYGENSVSINIPLSVKVKKTIQNKKKEYESMQVPDHEDEEEDDGSADKPGGGQRQGGSHIIDSNQWKFGMNEYELEGYPITTKNIFEVKNLESSVLWIRVDPDMEYIRKVKVKQGTNNWLFQLLLEKDIIGQIEAIMQLYKTESEPQFVYEILQSVSTNESYFVKVRKMALKYLQKMQTSQFNKFLSHEKFLIKIFNQRNFDPNIGFYKSNDFSKVLEYYFDKYLLKTLAKCKEIPLQLERMDKEMHQPKVVQNEPGNISISLKGTDFFFKAGELKPKEHLLKISSDHIAQLLLKLLQENDNSENHYDDSFYLKQIIKSLGSLDSFKFMPEITKEIYRQFKLDHIGRFSPQFSITKGAIAAYFNIRKQIYLFQNEKKQNIDDPYIDLNFYENQIKVTEELLQQMNNDLQQIGTNDNWPYEIRFFLFSYRIKHCFFYEKNNFMKALYIQLKVIDNLQNQRRIRDSIDYTKLLAHFLEKNVERLDFRAALVESEQACAIVGIFWSFICLPFNYIDSSLEYWVKRIFYLLYGNQLPLCMIKWQHDQSIQEEIASFDQDWNNDQIVDASQMREQQVRNRQQQKQQQKISYPMRKVENAPKVTNELMKMEKIDTKLRIILPQTPLQEQTSFIKNTGYGNQQQPAGGSIKISLGNLGIDTFKPQQQSTSIMILNESRRNETDISKKQQDYFEQEKVQQQQLMQSISNNQMNGESAMNKVNKGDQDQMMNGEGQNDDESVYDEFAEISFPIDWVQKMWLVTGEVWYHEESQAFLYPVTIEDLGEYFDYYLSIIKYPIDLTTIKEKIKDNQYQTLSQWLMDMDTMFKNCKAFNEESSEIYQSALKLERFYFQKMRDIGLSDYTSKIRIA